MTVVRSIEALRSACPEHSCAFVPTMGALHDGHIALIRRAIQTGRSVVVSLFVNPTQFGPGEDYETYPRQPEKDIEIARKVGAAIVFAPATDLVYPEHEHVPVPPLPEVATEPQLEDRFRRGHFAGVCQVVARLFDLVRPACAIFGEKDYQQLLVIRAMVRATGDRWGGVEIIGHPTVREPDGLAMSSRNAYLDESERYRALGLIRALRRAQALPRVESAEQAMRDVLEAHGVTVEYAVVRDAESLMPLHDRSTSARGLIAVRVGPVRLIDNLEMTALP